MDEQADKVEKVIKPIPGVVEVPPGVTPQTVGAERKDSNRGSFGNRGGARVGTGRGGSRPGGKDGGKRFGGKGGGRGERPRSEYDQKSIEVRRVARVVAGGRRFSFSVAMIIGNRKGQVGVGTGKAGDISLAMEKATKDAKKNLVTLKLTKTNSIAHEVSAKYSSATVALLPAPARGLVAGSAVRNVLTLAGITDISAKVHSGSKNKLNMARATVKALTSMRQRSK